MRTVVGIVFRGDRYYRGQEMWNSDVYWLTERQYRIVYASQDKPETKGRYFTVNTRVFRLADIAYAVPVDLDNKTVKFELTRDNKIVANKYLFDELEKEGVDVSPYVAEARERFNEMYGDKNGKKV